MLVSYSSSEDESSDQNPRPIKKRRIADSQNGNAASKVSSLPPLPTDFHDLYATSVRSSTSDDPSLHGGRKRTTPHVVGNWPSHVYLEWFPSSSEVKVLNAVLGAVQKRRGSDHDTKPNLRSLITSELGAPLPLHISLSASLSLTTDNKDGFLDKLTTSLANVHGLHDFEVKLTHLLWAPNYDRTRWFLVVGVERPAGDELNLLLKCCNRTCEQAGLPTLYQSFHEKGGPGRSSAAAAPLRQGKANPTEALDEYSDMFHFSLGWSLEEPVNKTLDLNDLEGGTADDLKSIRVRFDSVKVKIGNTITSVPLKGTLKDRNVLI